MPKRTATNARYTFGNRNLGQITERKRKCPDTCHAVENLHGLNRIAGLKCFVRNRRYGQIIVGCGNHKRRIRAISTDTNNRIAFPILIQYKFQAISRIGRHRKITKINRCGSKSLVIISNHDLIPLVFRSTEIDICKIGAFIKSTILNFCHTARKNNGFKIVATLKRPVIDFSYGFRKRNRY